MTVKTPKDFMPAAREIVGRKPVVAAIESGWKERLISVKGKQLPIVANALIALRHAPEWQGVLGFNLSSYDTVALRTPPWNESRTAPFTWTDEDDIRTADWLQHQGVMAGKETTGQAVQTAAKDNPFHPIRDRFQSLVWDRVERLNDWLTLYLGVEPSDYARAVGRKWLIGGVARIYQPGCKNDTCLILEGQQGTLKSTALRVLAEPYFTDDMPELGTKDSSLQTRGVWLIELSELDSMSRSEVSRVKAFMSRSVDRFRPPFGRRPIEAERECFFAGTSNHSNYLRDETGGRRFWPVKCGSINIPDLRRDRDQLLAEATHHFRAGETWWLDDRRLVEAATVEQRERYEGDAWEQKVATWIEARETVSVADVLEMCIEKPQAQWTQIDQNRVARMLRSLGWEKFRMRDGKRLEWRYRRLTD